MFKRFVYWLMLHGMQPTIKERLHDEEHFTQFSINIYISSYVCSCKLQK